MVEDEHNLERLHTKYQGYNRQCSFRENDLSFPYKQGFPKPYLGDQIQAPSQFQLELLENLTIAPLQCLACSKRPECLRISSGKVILTSIKGHNSLTNLRKMTANNPKIDLVNINSYIKFGQNLVTCNL